MAAGRGKESLYLLIPQQENESIETSVVRKGMASYCDPPGFSAGVTIMSATWEVASFSTHAPWSP